MKKGRERERPLVHVLIKNSNWKQVLTHLGQNYMFTILDIATIGINGLNKQILVVLFFLKLIFLIWDDNYDILAPS